jgi:hypothetical protein
MCACAVAQFLVFLANQWTRANLCLISGLAAAARINCTPRVGIARSLVNGDSALGKLNPLHFNPIQRCLHHPFGLACRVIPGLSKNINGLSGFSPGVGVVVASF